MSHAFHTRVNPTADVAINPRAIIRILRTHVSWWIVPVVVCTVLAAVYSLVAAREWRATQGLIIRPEAAGIADERLGKFADLSEMKTLQETILELAKSQSVVRAALREVGPPCRYRRPAQWPKPLDVEDFRDAVDMRPPGGAEFGKTEVFYISVRDTSRERAAALVAALCGQLEQRMQEIRDQRAQGMIAELERTVAMANADLSVHNERLASFEAKIGPDLAELRNLNAQVGSQGEVSQELQAIEAERRSNEASHRANVRLLKLLSTAHNDPQQLLATPNSLLQSQPAVSQLKNALVEAQLHTARLLGSRSGKHPFVIAAREAEELVRRQLHDEVAVAIRGLEVDVELGAEREQALAARWNAARARLSRLAGSRAEYAMLIASAENHTRLIEAARKNLADARASQAGARSASVIARIDGVEAGVRPVGASRKTITAAGGAGGLVLGLGLVFLFANSLPTGHVINQPMPTTTTLQADSDSEPRVHLATNGSAHAKSNGKSAKSAEQSFGMFHGMTLDEAIRSVAPRRC